MCRTFIRDLFALVTNLKQFIHLKWLLNILSNVSRPYLIISSHIKHRFFLYFVNGDRHIFPPARGRKDWDVYGYRFSGYMYNNNNGDVVNQQYLRKCFRPYVLLQLKLSSWKLPWKKWLKLTKGLYSQLLGECIWQAV